jgi:hypothetical protein
MENHSTVVFAEKRIAADCGFVKSWSDESNLVCLNGFEIHMEMYNVILSIRDLSLYMKGIKANRFFKIGDVYAHYGWKLRRDHAPLFEWLTDVHLILSAYEQQRRMEVQP